jgi:hypothetical protein
MNTGNFGDPVWLRRIDAQGNLSAATLIADSVDGRVGPVIGPVHGRYLFGMNKGFRLVDRDGTVVASNDTMGFGYVVAHAEQGFVVSGLTSVARLISADDLTELVTFDIAGPGVARSFNPDGEHWSLFDDGSLYISEAPHPRNGNRPRLARFAIPGSPADDIIFIDRF